MKKWGWSSIVAAFLGILLAFYVVAIPTAHIIQTLHDGVAQLTAPVRWTQSVLNMTADGADHFMELGPGNVLQGLVKKIAPEATTEGRQ